MTIGVLQSNKSKFKANKSTGSVNQARFHQPVNSK